jgi:hypothetical protein
LPKPKNLCQRLQDDCLGRVFALKNLGRIGCGERFTLGLLPCSMLSASIFSAVLLPGGVLTTLTPYLLWLGFIGFAGAGLYFVLERGNLAPEFRVIASLNAVVALVTAISYYYLSGLGGAKMPIPQSVVQTAVQLHYLDWLITLPLLLLQIPVLLGMDRSSRWLMVRMVLCTVALVAVGMVGEWQASQGANAPLSVDTAFTLYGVAVAA